MVAVRATTSFFIVGTCLLAQLTVLVLRAATSYSFTGVGSELVGANFPIELRTIAKAEFQLREAEVFASHGTIKYDCQKRVNADGVPQPPQSSPLEESKV